MFGQTIAIFRNTFFESIRQPITLVLLVVATLGLIFSNLLAGFTMEDDQRMMIDLGLSTVFICGTLLAAFIATNVLNREIENRTALTVISKPVSRPLFVVGKFLGVAAALLLVTVYMSFIFMLVEMHGVRQTVRDPHHVPVLVFGSVVALLGLGASVWCNYFYGKVFASTVVTIVTPLIGLAYLLCLMFDPGFTRQPISMAFDEQMWIALAGITMAIMVLTAIAIAASTRLGQVMTLCVTVGIFVLGMLSDWIFGRPIRAIEAMWLQRASARELTEIIEQTQIIQLVTGEVDRRVVEKEVVLPGIELSSMADGLWERLEYAACWIAYSVLPNFQSFWFSDALTQGHVIPLKLLWGVVGYGLIYITAALCLAVILFQRREVG